MNQEISFSIESRAQFPESQLPILAPKELNSFKAYEFWNYINSLFAPRSGGKVVELKPNGAVKQNPTKGPKRPFGTFEVRFVTPLGTKKFEFQFNREKKIQCNIEEIQKAIECPIEILKDFLEKKKFLLPN